MIDEDGGAPADLEAGEGHAEPRAPGAEDSVRRYLREIGRVALLTAAEEVEVARRIERGEERLGRALAGIPLARRALGHRDPGDETAGLDERLARVRREYARGVKSPAKTRLGLPLQRLRAVMAEIDAAEREVREAKRAMVEANLRLVVAVAKRYLGARVPLLDLVQEGNLGLMKAVDRFDYHRGFKFSTYATWWIRQAITRAIADRSRTIRMPVHLSDALGRLVRVQRALEQELRRAPTTDEIARRAGMPPKKVRLILDSARVPLSLETLVGEDSELGQLLPDPSASSPDEGVLREDLVRQVERALATLHPREGQVLRLRFGLDGGSSASLEEVGERFGLTRERIRQIEGKALRKLRHPLRGRHLRAFVER